MHRIYDVLNLIAMQLAEVVVDGNSAPGKCFEANVVTPQTPHQLCTFIMPLEPCYHVTSVSTHIQIIIGYFADCKVKALSQIG